ncbi:MAG: hypothetical protein SPL10_06295, partial [Synergistales bacterium]|nr:hypothetical protein [Synergistales bacterium]MDY6401389.1 hypothetical protein [Synergistales bacterium]MDY6404818.1 hypothetical protein [Synergistales bacterium]MDY6410399.1 hypothetical protein [Synergistales bacterium]MDY6414751.1 hypothetical protein [Synergistales bacterium]
EKKLTVPSMTWIDRLRTESEGGNIYSVPLVAGTEYTFEFSKNLTDSLGGILPHLSFYDPDNSLLDLNTAEEVEVTSVAYPKENPSMICYTFTPEVTGDYFVRIVDGEPYSGLYLDDSGNLQTFTPEADKGVVLFIYKERRSKDGDDGETGYYTRFTIKDADGDVSETISVEDLLQLRKLFCASNPTFFKKVYGQGLPNDDYGDGADSFEIKLTSDDKEYYESYIEQILGKLGAIYGYPDLYELLTAEQIKQIEAFEALGTDSGDASADALIEKFAEELKDKLKTKVLNVLTSSSAVSTSALANEPSDIEAEITGVPYDDRYHMGRGVMAYTLLSPPGGVTINLTKAYEKSQRREQRLQSYLNVTSVDINADKPKATDTQATHPITTEYYAKFVNTASQSESLSKTSANVSLAMSALGLSYGTGSTSNFKFGLTSSTLVIHYEEREIGYRLLDDDELYAAWDKADFFDMINEDYNSGPNFVRDFRNDFGDYYVSGYQYGACFDAYIGITTQTSEQLKEVESKLAANLNVNSFSSSADISNKTKDTLKKNQATITVNIVTSGMGKLVPKPINIPVSNDIKAMDNVFDELLKFRNQLGASATRAGYAPIRVKMSRWRSHPKVFRRMKKKGDTTGQIPLTVGQTIKISGFNTKLRNLRAYRNVVADNPAINGTVTAPLEERFNKVITLVNSAGERFYDASAEANASFDQTVTEVNDLTAKFKALADRYTFYTKLKIAQQQEKDTYERLEAAAKGAEEGSATAYDNVRKMPFGGEHGGSSGYVEFKVSEYVQADIEAGKRDYKDVHISRPKSAAWRIEWTHHDVQSDSELISYVPDVKPAKLTAAADGGEAVFCYVRANSSNADAKDDRARWLVRGSPAVGTKVVDFYFKSGYSSSIDWEIEGQAIRMTKKDYPFDGLTTEH